MLALASISSTDLTFVDAVRALGVAHPVLDEGLDALAAVMTVGMEQAPGVLHADLRIARGLSPDQLDLVGRCRCSSRGRARSSGGVQHARAVLHAAR